MSKEKKTKEIHVENLVIHAKKVEVIREHHKEREHHEEHHREHQRDPWEFLWGRRRERPVTEESSSSE